jgi:hypothetical protein
MFDQFLRFVCRLRGGPEDQEEPSAMFSRWRVRRNPSRDLTETVSFWVSEALYQDIQQAVAGNDASPFIRSSVRLGLGLFSECPLLMRALDARGKKERSMSCLMHPHTVDKLMKVSGDRKSHFVRASIELGLVYFAQYPEHVVILENTQKR